MTSKLATSLGLEQQTDQNSAAQIWVHDFCVAGDWICISDQHLQRGAKWFLKGINSPFLGFNWHPFEGPGMIFWIWKNPFCQWKGAINIVNIHWFPWEKMCNVLLPALIPTKVKHTNLLVQWLKFKTFWNYIFSRENKPFKRLYFRVPFAKWDYPPGN